MCFSIGVKNNTGSKRREFLTFLVIPRKSLCVASLTRYTVAATKISELCNASIFHPFALGTFKVAQASCYSSKGELIILAWCLYRNGRGRLLPFWSFLNLSVFIFRCSIGTVLE